MNIITWLVAGGLIGWAASAVMRTRDGLFVNWSPATWPLGSSKVQARLRCWTSGSVSSAP